MRFIDFPMQRPRVPQRSVATKVDSSLWSVDIPFADASLSSLSSLNSHISHPIHMGTEQKWPRAGTVLAHLPLSAHFLDEGRAIEMLTGGKAPWKALSQN